MGKELPLARPEGRGAGLLLAESRIGVSSSSPSGRDERKEAATATRKAKSSKTKNPSAKSKASPKAKNSYGGTTKRGGPRQSDSNRESDRRLEGRDRRPRRSASELGIEWIGSYCPDGQPHFLIGSQPQDGWSTLKCKYCSQYKLLPVYMNEVTDLTRLLHKHGGTNGYQKFLDNHKEARMLIAKLQYLWRVNQHTTDKVKFISMVVKVMEDKEFDRKEVSYYE